MAYVQRIHLPVQQVRRECTLEAREYSDQAGNCWTFSVLAPPAAEPLAPSGGDGGRPVMFCFNGGPGVSSMWVQLSGLAPWRAAPQRGPDVVEGLDDVLELTDESLFDHADLVFIDPPGTGLDTERPSSQAMGAANDAALMSRCILDWLTSHDRLASPLYLLGESYGTIRAALVASHLDASTPRAHLRGIALLGQCLNAQEVTQRPGNAAGFVAALPYLAATAWYHGKGLASRLSLDEVTSQARTFARTHYSAALSTGEFSPAVAQRLSELTGLELATLERLRYRVDKEWFRRHLLASEGAWIGLTDGRYTAAHTEHEDSDPAAAHLDHAFAQARALLHHRYFGLPLEQNYTESFEAHPSWNYLEEEAQELFGGSPLPSPFATFDYPRHLERFLASDQRRRLFIGTGHFDALTTVGGVDHLLTHYGLPTQNIDRHEYAAGHMMYSNRESSRELVSHLKSFLAATAFPSHTSIGAPLCSTP